jgi:hypothetical protein
MTVKRSDRAGSSRKGRTAVPKSTKLREIMVIGEDEGLLCGKRSQVAGGRMPEALVVRTKQRTGINPDMDLVELALANIAVDDHYADWLLSRRGAVSREADLEF